MGIITTYDVVCDHEDCTLWLHGGSLRSDAIESAREAGWSRVRGKGWFCPEHRPTPRCACYFWQHPEPGTSDYQCVAEVASAGEVCVPCRAHAENASLRV